MISLLDKACRYCSASEHCEWEVRQKLQQWGAAEAAEVDKIIDYLYQENYINEERFCKAYVHDKLLYQGWGRDKLRLMLSEKRLNKAVVKEALDNIKEEDYMSVLEKQLAKKLRELKNEPDGQKKREKLIRYLLSHGFRYDEIMKKID